MFSSDFFCCLAKYNFGQNLISKLNLLKSFKNTELIFDVLHLWVKWINNVYLKDSDWWQYISSHDYCWYLKKVCSTSDTFAPDFVMNGWLNV